MSRRMLPLAMFVSLWPVGFIAVSIATASNHENSNSETVEVTVPSTPSAPAATPKTTRVHLKFNGKTYDCPTGTRNKLNPIDQRLGELQLELTSVRRAVGRAIRRLEELDKVYPNHTAPTQTIVDQYNGLVRTARRLEARETHLVRSYNDAVDEHNVLEVDCQKQTTG